MKTISSVVLEAASAFEKMAEELFAKKVMAQDMAASAQAADVKAAVAASLGLKSVGGGDYEFDVNSKSADVIFNTMEKVGFSGSLSIQLVADKNKKAVLQITTNPANEQGKKAAAAIAQSLTPGVNAGLAKMKLAISDTITIPEIVTASNVA